MAGRDLAAMAAAVKSGATQAPAQQQVPTQQQPTTGGRDLGAMAQSMRKQAVQQQVGQAAENLISTQKQVIDQQRADNTRMARGMDASNKSNQKKAQLQSNSVAPQQRNSVEQLVGEYMNVTNKLRPQQQQPTSMEDRVLAARKAQVEAGKGRATVPTTRELGAIVDAAGQGLSLGTSDEIEAGITTGFGLAGDYDARLEEVRERMRLNREESPNLYAATEIGTAFVPAVEAARWASLLTKGAKPAARVGAQIAAGTAEGTLAGSGYSEAGFGSEQFWDDALTGAGWGLLASTLGEGAAKGASSLAKKLNTKGGQETISKQLQELKPEGVTTAEYAGTLQKKLGNLITDLPELPQNYPQNSPAYQEAKQARDVINRKVKAGEGKITRLPDGRRVFSQASLADIEELTGLVEALGEVKSPSGKVQQAMAERSRVLEGEAKDVLSRELTPEDMGVTGDTIFGHTVQFSDLVPDTKLLNPEAFTSRIRREANEVAAPFYEASQNMVPNKEQRKLINATREKYPLFDKYWKSGRNNALESDVNRQSAVKAMDEAVKNIDADINTLKEAQRPDSSQIARLTRTRERFNTMREDMVQEMPIADIIENYPNPEIAQRALKTLAELKIDIRDLAKPSTIARQIGQAPRELASNIQRGIDAQQATGPAGRTVRQDAQTRAFAKPETVGAQQGVGAGTVLRDVVDRRPRGASGELATPTELADFNRSRYGAAEELPDMGDYIQDPYVQDIFDADTLAANTAKRASATPKTIMENLQSNMRARFQDLGALAALTELVRSPTATIAGISSARLGQASRSRALNRKLVKDTQDELFKLGITENEIKNILDMNFEKIPSNRLVEIGNKLAERLGITEELATDYIRAATATPVRQQVADDTYTEEGSRPVIAR